MWNRKMANFNMLLSFRFFLLFFIFSVSTLIVFQNCGPGFYVNRDLVYNSSYDDIPFQPTSGVTALSKTKFLLHGGSLTSEEINQATNISNISPGTIGENVQLNRTALKILAREWLESAAGKEKMQRFLALNLQQEDLIVPGIGFFLGRVFPQGPSSTERRWPFRNVWQRNIEESFARTAIDIVYNGRPFTEIVTTRQVAVTTALLSTLSFIDNHGNGPFDRGNRGFHRLMRNVFVDSDFNDWRIVTITQATSASQVTIFSNVNALRSVGENAEFPLMIPRVGFFNTPAFQIKWETNQDNQFRVTTNQALIGALNLSFDANDKTPHGNLSALPTNHAAPGTACFQCHRLMDPMRETFNLSYNYFYRKSTGGKKHTPAFAFMGHQGPANSMDSLARTIASHPDFADSWVQKLCTYANSQPCNSMDPEYLRLVNLFKKSRFNFKELVIDMFSSPIITGSEETGSNGLKANRISVARQYHFCHALNMRNQELRSAGNVTKFNSDLCAVNNLQSALRSGISTESINRGSVDIAQSPEFNALIYRSFEKVCEQASHYVIPENDNPLPYGNDLEINASIAKIAYHIMGLPPNHPRFHTTTDILREVYDYSKNSLEQQAIVSLRNVFEFACISPDTTGMGL